MAEEQKKEKGIYTNDKPVSNTYKRYMQELKKKGIKFIPGRPYNPGKGVDEKIPLDKQ